MLLIKNRPLVLLGTRLRLTVKVGVPGGRAGLDGDLGLVLAGLVVGNRQTLVGDKKRLSKVVGH